MKRILASIVSLAILLSVTPSATLSAHAEPAAFPANSSDCIQLFTPHLRQLELVSGEVRSVKPGDERAEGVPTLLIHGWLDTALDTDERPGTFSRPAIWTGDSALDTTPKPEATEGNESEQSIAQRLLNVPRSSVFVFDYDSLSAQWIVGKSGHYLSGSLDCLFEATGQRVNVVAHSMGGLAARLAIGSLPERSQRIGQVVTIATPNLGSEFAAIAGNLTPDISNSSWFKTYLTLNPALYLIFAQAESSFLHCVERTQNDKNDSCAGFAQIEGFFAGAGEALRAGSDELKALPSWPADVNVHAIAGSISGKAVTRLLHSNVTVPISLGDTIVPLDSAVEGSTSKLIVECPLPSIVFGVYMGPCGHNGLLNNLTVIDSVVEHIEAAVAASPTVARVLQLRDWQFSYQGLGPLQVGLSRSEVMAMVRTTYGDDPSLLYYNVEDCQHTACTLLPRGAEGPNELFVDWGVGGSDAAIRGIGVRYADDLIAQRLSPKTDRGIGYGSTRADVRAAYADQYIWEWRGHTETGPLETLSGISVRTEECAAETLVFGFDSLDEDATIRVIRYTMPWDLVGCGDSDEDLW